MSPKTRGDIEREDKIEELVAIAERRLLAGGYQEMSVSAIAREIGIAPNAVYWYFPSKDALFVAVLERLLEKSLRAAQRVRTLPFTERLLWGVDKLHGIQHLATVVHERARESSIVADFAGRFHDLLRTMLVETLRPHVEPEALALATEAVIALVEGMFLHDVPKKQRDELILFVLERLTTPRASRSHNVGFVSLVRPV